MKIPAALVEIGPGAFSDCAGLTAIRVDDDNPAYCSLEGVLFNKEKTILVQYPGGRNGAYIIPDGVTRIESYAFSECAGLSGVTIPRSVVDIGELAFLSCSSLVDITIPDGVIEISRRSFESCTGLTNVVVGSGVTLIQSRAFTDCPSLETLYFKGNAPEVAADAFGAPTKVGKVYYLEGTTGWTNPWNGIPTEAWNPEPRPVLAWRTDETGELLILSWSGALAGAVEVAPSAEGPWTVLAPKAELIGGAWQLAIPISGASGFYRLTVYP